MFGKRVADDYEDEWEREVSLNDNNHKRQQNNHAYSRQIDILEQQYNTLSELHDDLNNKLKDLKGTLVGLEGEEEHLVKQSKTWHQTYNESLDTVIAMIYQDTKGFLDDKNGYDIFIQKHNALSDQILALLTKWKAKLKDNEKTNMINSKEKELDSWISAFKRTELARIDLSMQIEGFTSRIEHLQKQTSKLNTLPQIPSILEASTNTYYETMKEIGKRQGTVEQVSILPCLDRLVELKITNTLQQKHMRSDYNLLQAIIEDLQLAYRASLRLRAIQQLLTFVFDDEIQSKQNKLSVLEALTVDLEERVEKEEEMKQQAANRNTKQATLAKRRHDYDGILKMLEVDSLKSAVKRLEKMQKKDKKSNAKWADELQHYLTTIDELNGIQSTLSNALHQHSSNEYIPSSSTNGTSEAPKHYLDLQTELDFRLQELQSSISALEKDANDPKNQAIFEEQKRLFSLFYTDADVFEQIYSEKK